MIKKNLETFTKVGLYIGGFFGLLFTVHIINSFPEEDNSRTNLNNKLEILSKGIVVGSALGGASGGFFGLAREKWLELFRGKVVQILGPKQTGKNSVYNTIVEISNNCVDPTSESTENYYQGKRRTKLKIFDGLDSPSGFFKDTIELSGESVSKWKEIIKRKNPYGIIYVTDSYTEYNRDPEKRDEKFKLEAKGICEIARAISELGESHKVRLSVLLILVNKIDKIADGRKAIADTYMQDLYKYQVKNDNGQNIELIEFINQLFPSDIKIYSEVFCAENGQRDTDDHKTSNQKVLLNFWQKILNHK